MRKPYTPEEILLTGKVAVVTGAARGLGRAIAESLREFGAELALCDRDPIDGFDTLTMTMDVRDPVALEVFGQAVRERFGRVDVLVNNAGGTFHAAFAETSPRGESTLIAENFTQVTAVIRQFLPLMAPGASIVNVTSSEAHQAAPGFAVYAAMKAAVESLTRSLALELAPRRIRVNAVAPDALPTGGEEAVRERMAADPLPFEPVRLPPLGHLGDPAEAGAAVVFLASEMAGFVTGTTLHVDGGIHAAGGWRRTGP
ncbi:MULTISPECIES: SDR family NAD(P)-dependent oxidoreductase [Streptosporangium]|uniref:NAD(P)-dependent dehydrogenase (Short-subunit alcohol dehydrogenase family) n=1 Tax=Streptosporangium brasiliense TaxID=47480 RepID=A0ABT9RAH1_9ACTN|nr:SDR family oxidoreductase [Streptosporangium brasiliense]MDP9866249.1 NAD(P)-dependent dehydrogenase (short-subunit alcohol dehydrogenase family) [Streptosporangium brasiliense]